MAAPRMTGLELLLELRRMDADQLRLPAHVLLDELDVALCEDCRRHHPDVWSAIACDQLVDAAARRHAARAHRLNRHGPDEPDQPADVAVA